MHIVKLVCRQNCYHQKHSFLKLKLHHKPFGGRTPPGPAGDLQRSPDPSWIKGWAPGRIRGKEAGVVRKGEGKGGRKRVMRERANEGKDGGEKGREGKGGDREGGKK